MDIFQVFGIQTREDKYTFVLCEFLKNDEFRNRAKEFFGFSCANFNCTRESLTLEVPTAYRKKITPDIILYDDDRIAVIESKMFSSEGYKQTEDYKKAEELIINYINQKSPSEENRIVEYYYFTLTGMTAANSCFKPLYWSEFYKSTLKDMDFQDEALNCVANAIYSQAVQYGRLVSVENFEKLKELKYCDLFSNDTYWIRPYSLFASGVNNDLWGLSSDYSIYNGNINGQGHAEFVTNLKKAIWKKEGIQPNDTIHLFIRCEWNKNELGVYLNWENYIAIEQENKNGIVTYYIATKDLISPVKDQSIANKHCYMDEWKRNKKKHSGIKNLTNTDKKKSVLRILKCSINCDNKSVGEVLEEAKKVIEYYEGEINHILQNASLKDGLIVYSSNE